MSADMVPMRMRRGHSYRQKSQSLRDRADICNAQPRVDEKRPFPAAEQITMRFFPMLFFADRKRIRVYPFNRKPIFAHISIYRLKLRRPFGSADGVSPFSLIPIRWLRAVWR